MSAKSISLVAAIAMLGASVPAYASVETRSSAAIPAVAVKHVRYAQDNDRGSDAGRAARNAARAGGGGGGLGVSTGVLAALAGVLGAIGIAVAVQNRSN